MSAGAGTSPLFVIAGWRIDGEVGDLGRKKADKDAGEVWMSALTASYGYHWH